MGHPHLGHRFVEDGSWAVLAGPAHSSGPDPHVLVMASPDRLFLQGVLVGCSARADCVEVRYGLDPMRGVHRGEARFLTERGAGELASSFKRRGFRLSLHPVVHDEVWYGAFRRTPVPREFRWTLPLGVDRVPAGFEGHANWPWLQGAAWTRERPVLPGRKLCLASWERARLDGILLAIASHPQCYGVKSNHPKSDDRSFLGRAVFLDDETTGWVCRQLEEQVPDVIPVVQDDHWFQAFRNA